MPRRVDVRWMRRAIELAERGRGAVGANPLVGSVVVRGGRAVGEGWHAAFGGPHAEAAALSRAGERARGGRLYVTLEPCTRLGKTPPCVRMIVAAGVREVICALADPQEGGRGFAELRRNGVTVVRDVLRREAADQNEEFLIRQRTRRPFVTLKLAMTLDGKIADHRSRSKWISSSRARKWTRGIRRRVDAVMVGVGTALADDPGLKAPGSGRRPVRVIVDSAARTPPDCKVLRGGGTVIAATERAPRRRVLRLVDRGAEVLVFRARRGRVPLRALMSALYAKGVGAILCEGGSRLAGSLVEDRLVDRMVMVISPKIIGGERSLPSLLGRGRSISNAFHLGSVKVRTLGADTILEGVPEAPRGGS